MEEDYLPPNKVQKLLSKYGTGYREKSDTFFKPGNKLLIKNLRLGIVSEKDDDSSSKTSFCNVPNCNFKFESGAEFTRHYNSLHRYSCSVCKKNMPSAHLLDLHLMENHDSYFDVLAEKEPSFRCYLPECPAKFRTMEARHDHGIVEHKIPNDFRFFSKAGKAITNKNKELPKERKKIVDFSFGHNASKAFETSYAKVLTGTKNKDTVPNTSHVLEDNKMIVDLLESLPN